MSTQCTFHILLIIIVDMTLAMANFYQRRPRKVIYIYIYIANHMKPHKITLKVGGSDIPGHIFMPPIIA